MIEVEFLQTVARAAFENPFGSAREELNRELAAHSPGEGSVVDRAVAYVNARLNDLRPLSVKEFRGAQQEAIRAAVLFDVFHRFASEFDLLVRSHLTSQPGGVPAAFGREVMRLLVKDGFEEEEAVRFVGIFYQLRRAFYFATHHLIGETPSIQALRARLWANIFTTDIELYESHLWDRMEDFSTFLIGPTGSGKGAAASVLGYASWIPFDPKKGEFVHGYRDLFVEVNLSQFAESLIESELFGHRKGAFTGAIENYDGVLGLSRKHGLIFLDEIGEVSIPVQIKLLRVLQERLFTPVGGHEPVRFEGRVVAATNRSVSELQDSDTFRNDFYYRLSSDVISVPSLRRRLDEDPDELELLVRHIVRRMLGDDAAEAADRVLEGMQASVAQDYTWPGNVRELEQCVRRMLILGRDPHFARPLPSGQTLASAIEHGTLTARQMLVQYCQLLYERHGTYEEVARRADLDRRTAKKYVEGDAL